MSYLEIILSLQRGVHLHHRCQMTVILVVEEEVQAIDLPQQGEAGGLQVKLGQLLPVTGTADGHRRFHHHQAHVIRLPVSSYCSSQSPYLN